MDCFRENRGTKISGYNLFRQYSGNENHLTKALLHVIEESGPKLLFFIARNLGIDLNESYFSVFTQKALKEDREKDDYSTIDGLITFSPLQFLIESKIKKNAVNINQLDRHRDYVDLLRNKAIPTILLYITPDDKKPEELKKDETVIWCNWETMHKIVDKYYDDNHIESKLKEAFDGCYKQIFSGHDSIPPEDLVAVLAGSHAEPYAKANNIYHCQPWRTFRGARYLAFYCNKKISYVFKVLKVYNSKDEIKDPELIEKTKNLASDKIFVLEEMKDFIKPIINDKTDYMGNPTAFTMGQPRYFSLSDLKKANKTSDLEKTNKI